MSTARLLSSLRAQAQMAAQGRGSMRRGLVTSYDPAKYAVKVSIQPDAVETGWIPLAAQAVGNGWGILTPPGIGDQITVLMQESDPEAGVAAQCLFNAVDLPPSVPSQEFWLVHKTGSSLKFLTDGSVELHVAKNLTATVAGTTDITTTGKLTLTAQADVAATISGSLSADVSGTGTLSASSWEVKGSTTFDNDITVNGSTTVKAITSNGHDISSTHMHTGVTSGPSVSGPPQ